MLIDFGLSKQFNQSGEPESSTTIGLGTPGYAPIEQANYHEHSGLPATLDIYALGATMMKMLTGVGEMPTASDILNDGFPFGLFAQAGVSEKTTAVVNNCLHSADNCDLHRNRSARLELRNQFMSLRLQIRKK